MSVAEREPEQHPSLTDKRWAGGSVTSSARNELVTHWIGAVIWNLLAVPVSIAWWTQRGGDDWAPFLDFLLPLFALVGPLLLVQAIRATSRWRRFAGMRLVLDPFPGSIGGHVGGSIELPLVRAGEGTFKVALSSVHRRVRRGKNGSTWETVLWSREIRPTVEPDALGVRLRFTFEVPVGLEPSQPKSDDQIFWAIRVRAELPGADLDQAFQVPVFATEEPLYAEVPALADEVAADPFDLPRGTVRAMRSSGRVVLDFPRGREGYAGLMLIIFGAVFAGAGWFFFDTSRAIASGSGLEVLVTGFMGFFLLIFGGIGVLMLFLGFFTLVNRLTVELSPTEITSTRSVLYPVRRSARVDQVTRIYMKVNGQVGQGAKADVKYEIRAVLDSGRKIPLGDGIPGNPLATQIAGIIAQATGLQVEEEIRKKKKAGRVRGSTPAEAKASDD